MSRIRSKDTSIEISLRKALWRAGIRYRKNYSEIPGTPDIAITKYQIAIFCDGEFWHGKDELLNRHSEDNLNESELVLGDNRSLPCFEASVYMPCQNL